MLYIVNHSHYPPEQRGASVSRYPVVASPAIGYLTASGSLRIVSASMKDEQSRDLRDSNALKSCEGKSRHRLRIILRARLNVSSTSVVGFRGGDVFSGRRGAFRAGSGGSLVFAICLRRNPSRRTIQRMFAIDVLNIIELNVLLSVRLIPGREGKNPARFKDLEVEFRIGGTYFLDDLGDFCVLARSYDFDQPS